MKHLLTSKVRRVMIIAIILTVAIALLSSLTDIHTPQQLVQSVLTPLRTGVQSLTRQAEQVYNYIFRYEALEAENELLRAQISEMQEEARSADAISRENDRLRELVDLTAAREDFSLVDGYIISWSSNDWSHSFTINRGSTDGIETGMCAITANGEVAGLVTEVGPNYSIVKSVLDSSLEISATIASSGYNGIVQGGYLSGEEGMLRMDYLPSSATVRNRDQVVTSGSTVYPRDLLLGYVVRAGFDSSGVAKYAVLEPAVDVGQLEQVFILTSFNRQ